jgi:hypothetical protein
MANGIDCFQADAAQHCRRALDDAPAGIKIVPVQELAGS